MARKPEILIVTFGLFPPWNGVKPLKRGVEHPTLAWVTLFTATSLAAKSEKEKALSAPT
jgi:hypothetical protein